MLPLSSNAAPEWQAGSLGRRSRVWWRPVNSRGVFEVSLMAETIAGLCFTNNTYAPSAPSFALELYKRPKA
jgi:hypothetical protein